MVAFNALILVVVILIGVAAVLFFLAGRPFYHRGVKLSDVRIYLSTLLRRGYDRGFIIISLAGSDEYVQFAKYIKGKGNIGLHLSFPRAPWSEEYYTRLKNVLRDQGTHFEIQEVNSEPVTEFLEVDCQLDLELAVRLIQDIVLKVFEKKGDVLVKITFSNVSARDELIDSVQKPG